MDGEERGRERRREERREGNERGGQTGGMQMAESEHESHLHEVCPACLESVLALLRLTCHR